MTTARATPPFLCPSRSSVDRRSTLLPSPKRVSGSLAPPAGPESFWYPSPPMSRPSSPPHTAHEPGRTTGDELSPLLPLVTTSSASSTAAPPTASTTPSSAAISPFQRKESAFGRRASDVPSAAALDPQRPGPPPFPVSPALSSEAGVRTGRKSKAHVASACVNCKRAHLSCDIQRPCARCIASGKQDTCYDVQHKKRGRPRLRDEGHFMVEGLSHEQPLSLGSTLNPATSSSRPIATPRPRRSSSFKSLQSQSSENTLNRPPNVPPFPVLQPAPSIVGPRESELAPADIPTAFFDTDLVTLRANRPFEQIMSAGRATIGRPLSSIASPADDQALDSIRARLQAEREAREQSSLPPLLQYEQDPLRDVSEKDVDRLASGFEDHTYTWRRGAAGGSGFETFPARVRLAKSSTYFVVVTLPSFHPVAQSTAPRPPTSYLTTPPTAYPEPSGLTAFPRPHSQPPPLAPSPSPYGLSSWPSPFQPPPPPSTAAAAHSPPPRLPAVEPPTQTTSTYARRASTIGDMLPPSEPGSMQLPPMMMITPSSSSAEPRRASSSASSDPTALLHRPLSSSEEQEDAERAPKKRKIMGIDNVLQQ